MNTVNQTIEVADYPYGFRNKTTAFFSIEFVKGKGFRSVFQTKNPSTGKLNAPKKSTYSPVMYLNADEKGHVSVRSLDFYGWEGIVTDSYAMWELFELFTEEQVKDIYAFIYMQMKVNTKAQCVYCGSKLDDLKPYIESVMDVVLEGFRNGGNHFWAISKLDVQGIQSQKVEGYNPFRTVVSEVI